jgi:hypothetical protein
MSDSGGRNMPPFLSFYHRISAGKREKDKFVKDVEKY